MDTGAAVTLTPHGAFRAHGPGGTHELAYDGTADAWNLVGPPPPGRRPGVLVARVGGLDHGLALLVAAAGRIGPFRVALPCGGSFARPGHVPASEVLAALGYRATRAVAACTLLSMPDGACEGEARREALRLLTGGIDLGEVEPVESESGVTWWCCPVYVPFDGMLRLSAADAVVAEALAGTGLEVAGPAEPETDASVLANAAELLSFVPASRAA